jgi:hypothetical protein
MSNKHVLAFSACLQFAGFNKATQTQERDITVRALMDCANSRIFSECPWTTATEWRNALLEWEQMGLVRRVPPPTLSTRRHVLDEAWTISASNSHETFAKEMTHPFLVSLSLLELVSPLAHANASATIREALQSSII